MTLESPSPPVFALLRRGRQSSPLNKERGGQNFSVRDSIASPFTRERAG